MNRRHGMAHRRYREAAPEGDLQSQARLTVVTKTEDLSNIAPGKDRIAHGIEDVTLDLDVLVLPCLRRSDSLPSLHHAAAASQELKGMRKELFGLASACPYGEPANAPAWRRSA